MNVFANFANGLRDGILTADELQQRKEATDFCTMAKVGCVAAAIIIATASVFSILSGTFAGVVLGVAFGGLGLTFVHDGYQLFDNIQKIYDDAITEVSARLTKDTLKTHLTKGMILSRPILERWIDSINAERR